MKLTLTPLGFHMNPKRICLTTLFVIIVTGCAHPIKIAPDMARLERVSTTPPRLAAKVGYFIPPEVSFVEITTPGGGGDYVRYYPYHEMESGFQKILSNVFTSVVKLTSPSDTPTLVRDNVKYVIVPTVRTSSSGSGFFTWPPTDFTVDLTSQIKNTDGKIIANLRAFGVGSAQTSERLYEHGIAGRHAMEDALLKMQSALFEANLLGVVQSPPPASKVSIAERLAHIKELKDSGLITQEEYEVKRKEILEAL
jgi:hypothetical protein